MNKSIISVLLIFASYSSYAEPMQSLALLQSKIEQHLLNELASTSEGKVTVTAGKIDSRLNLRACNETQLKIFNPYQTPTLSTNTMGIKCNEDTNHWTLYVPVKISLLKAIYIAKRPLLKGTHLTETDIYQTELDVQQLKQGYFVNKEELVGQVCKQNITADSPLTPYNIELAKLVHKGEQVSILAVNENLTISMEGIALDDGAMGEPIKVRNMSSKKVVEAQVSGAKKVKVIL